VASIHWLNSNTIIDHFITPKAAECNQSITDHHTCKQMRGQHAIYR